MKGDTAQLGFVVLSKPLDRSVKKEGSSNSPLKGAFFYGNKTEIQEFSILDLLLLPGQTKVSVFQVYHHQSQKKEDTVYLASGGFIFSTTQLHL